MNSLAGTHQRDIIRLRKVYFIVDILDLLLVVNEAAKYNKILYITAMRKFGGFSL
jgi:hypothetical protein